MNKYILSLEDVSLRDIALCGGKASNLGELIKLGLNVPKGFVISTEVYKHKDFVDLEKNVLKAFEKLNCEYVAVRSSATSEDSSNTSWAGQLSTYLFTNKERLINNIKKCWESINSTRVNAYIKQNSINPSDMSVAVIVQEMVDADVSGVAFTTHPIIRDKNMMLIEAIYGLGEAVVSGMVTPDSYEVSKIDTIIKNINISEQSIKVTKGNNGTKIVDIELQNQKRQKLSTEQIRKLVEICNKIEEHYNYPQDIEWCCKNNELYILQSRPITTL